MNKAIEQNWLNCLIYAVLTLCTLFLILAYCKFVRRRCFTLFGFGRNAQRQQVPNENNADEAPPQMRNIGLSAAIIRSLPVIQFKNEVKKASDEDNMDCAVCLGEFTEDEWLRYLPNCAHLFHVSCIDTWFQSHSTCPLCRADVLYDSTTCNFSVSAIALLEALQRENACRERPLGHLLLDSILMGGLRSNAAEMNSDESVPAGPLTVGPNGNTVNDPLNRGLKYKGESSTGDSP